MQPRSEVILATIPGARDGEQLEVALCQAPGEGSRLELRQQTWGDGVGWFTQSRVHLEAHQVADLRNILGLGAGRPSGSARQRPLPRHFSTVSANSFQPRVIHADSA